MICYRYSERDLFDFAFNNVKDIELINLLIKEFGLDINWRNQDHYDTLLYQSLKVDLKTAKFLVSRGACVNSSHGGYPEKGKEQSYGSGTLIDFVQDWQTLKEDPEWLKNCGAVSVINLPKDAKKEKLKEIDHTRIASVEKKMVRSKDQLSMIAMNLPENIKHKLKNFISTCEMIDSSDLSKDEELSK